jgi:hypothetical protein
MGIKGIFSRIFSKTIHDHVSILNYDEKEIEKRVLKIHKEHDRVEKEVKWLINKNQEQCFEILFQYKYLGGDINDVSGWGAMGRTQFDMSSRGSVFTEIARHPEKFKRSGDKIICVDKSKPKEYSIDYDNYLNIKDKEKLKLYELCLEKNKGLIRSAKKYLIKLYHVSQIHKHLKNKELDEVKKLYKDILTEVNTEK